MPSELSDDIERAMPRGSRERFEHRLLRLVEPEPVQADPEPELAPEPTTIAEAEEAVKWAQTSAEHEAATATLDKLRSGRVVAAEPAPAPPGASLAPKTRTVMIKEILARDSAGLIAKIKEYQITEPLPPDGAPAPERLPEPPVPATSE